MFGAATIAAPPVVPCNDAGVSPPLSCPAEQPRLTELLGTLKCDPGNGNGCCCNGNSCAGGRLSLSLSSLPSVSEEEEDVAEPERGCGAAWAACGGVLLCGLGTAAGASVEYIGSE